MKRFLVAAALICGLPQIATAQEIVMQWPLPLSVRNQLVAERGIREGKELEKRIADRRDFDEKQRQRRVKLQATGWCSHRHRI